MALLPAPRSAFELAPAEPVVVIGHTAGLMGEGLRHVLNAEVPGCRVIETERMAPTIALLRVDQVDMLLLSLDLPGMNGYHTLAVLRTLYPRMTIAVIAETTDRTMFARCLAAGINGFIHAHEPVEEISYAIATMLVGRIYVSPVMAVTDWPLLRKPPAVPKPSRLTPRQQDVLQLLEQGAANKEIARTLSLSESTVKIHLAAIYRMLGVRNRTEAVVNAGRERP